MKRFEACRFQSDSDLARDTGVRRRMRDEHIDGFVQRCHPSLTRDFRHPDAAPTSSSTQGLSTESGVSKTTNSDYIPGSFFPVSRSYASKYLARVFSTTSAGNSGGGLFLSQPVLSSQSRTNCLSNDGGLLPA